LVSITKTHFSLEKKYSGRFRGLIGESVIEKYIKKELIPILIKKEGWDNIFYFTKDFFHVDIQISRNPAFPESQNVSKVFYEQKNEIEKFFLNNGLFPTNEFLSYFNKFLSILDYTPDGFLVKVKKTGERKLLGEALKKLDLDIKNEFDLWSEFMTKTILSDGRTREGITWDTETINKIENKMLFVVNGKVDAVEIKCTAQLSLQHPSYKKILSAGYVFRLFHVKIISLEEFDIEERVYTDPNELSKK